MKRVSWRQNLLYSVAALGGSLAGSRFLLADSNPTAGIVIGAILGANLAGYSQQKRKGDSILDELNQKMIDTSMIHGFVAYSGLIGYQAVSGTFLTPAEEIIAATTVMIVSLILQAFMLSDKLGGIEP
ncbi:MAG: hypothetical protein ABEJ24_05990 [Candidatus Magasanikbacteria bacterium]